MEPELERVMGIEPTLAAWEAAVLPLNYTRAGQAVYAPAGGGRNAGRLRPGVRPATTRGQPAGFRSCRRG